MTGARRGPGAALALAVVQPAPVPRTVAAALGAADDPAAAAERLTFHGAWGHAHRVTTALGLPVPAWLAEHGTGRRARTLEQHLRALHDLAQLGAVLDTAGVPWLVLKGPVLSALYPHADLRAYTDLDVLVAPDRLREALAALVAADWPVLETAEDLRRRPPVGEVHLRGPAGTPVDLHWHLFYRADHVSRSRLDAGALVAARRHGRVGTTPAPALAPGAHLAYVAAHAAAGGGNRLRWLTDVAHLGAAASPDDWSGTVAAARSWGVGQGVAVVLWRAARHVAAPVPGWVVPALAGRRTGVLCTTAEALDPLPTSLERGSATAALARRADRPPVRSLRDAVQAHLTRAGRRGRARRLPPREDVTRTPEGTRALSGFVDAVEAETTPRRRAGAPSAQ